MGRVGAGDVVIVFVVCTQEAGPDAGIADDPHQRGVDLAQHGPRVRITHLGNHHMAGIDTPRQ